MYRENDKFIYEGDLGMKTNERQTSAKKKLIPAVAMLTASAVMLTTATYAWFTMNRSAQVEGLQMSATTSSSLEISLGELDSVTNPAKDSTTWTRKIAVSDFYKEIGKLKPASSATGNVLYHVDETGVYAGGTKVADDTDVEAVKTNNTAKLTPGKATGKIAQLTEDRDCGYFIDVPMWIRSSNKTASTVYCTVSIVDGENADTTATGTDLLKAVRVAIIPVNKGNDSVALTGSATMTGAASDLTANTSDAGTTTIFGLNSDTYNSKVLNAVGKYSATGTTIAAPTVKDANDGTSDYITAKNEAVFELPAATESTYGVESFIVRVWIEGESEYCSDLTANQDWNINFDFSLDQRTGV